MFGTREATVGSFSTRLPLAATRGAMEPVARTSPWTVRSPQALLLAMSPTTYQSCGATVLSTCWRRRPPRVRMGEPMCQYAPPLLNPSPPVPAPSHPSVVAMSTSDAKSIPSWP